MSESLKMEGPSRKTWGEPEREELDDRRRLLSRPESLLRLLFFAALWRRPASSISLFADKTDFKNVE